jgi:hypothetical protein
LSTLSSHQLCTLNALDLVSRVNRVSLLKSNYEFKILKLVFNLN